MSVAIAIKIGSPNSKLNLVKTTISSIMTNIGTDKYKIIIAMAPFIDERIKNYIYNLKSENDELIDLMPEENSYWADFINQSIDRSSGYKYFIKSHDDIELLTPNFLSKVEDTLRSISEPVGWVSFTDKDYLNGHWAPSTRPGFHKDYLFENGWSRRKLFQFHSLPDKWENPSFFAHRVHSIMNIVRRKLQMKSCLPSERLREYYANLPYDFPTAPVKCHAPFNHFVLIEMDKLKKIGKCENWETYNALLVDEDWGLRALQLGLNNIWIPGIEYNHYRPYGGTRSWTQIKKSAERVHNLFFKKWGFHSEGRTNELDFIKDKYGNTNIPWSIDRRTYDWEYIQ